MSSFIRHFVILFPSLAAAPFSANSITGSGLVAWKRNMAAWETRKHKVENALPWIGKLVYLSFETLGIKTIVLFKKMYLIFVCFLGKEIQAKSISLVRPQISKWQ